MIRQYAKLKYIAITLFILSTLMVVIFLPNHPIDPWRLFNPKVFGVLILTMLGIQFFGYLAIRVFGQYFGLAITGFLGGFISSTAVFANLPHALLNYPHHKRPILASALLATVAMLIAILMILFVASRIFFLTLFWPVVSMILLAGIMALLLLLSHKNTNHITQKISPTFNIASVIFTALFIGAILIVITVIRRYVGIEGLLFASFLGGLFEVHSITLGTAVLYVGHQINLQDASYALILAILASFFSKIGLLWALTPRRFAAIASLYLFVIVITGAIVYRIMI